MSETDLVRRLMLHWSASGMRLFRNNCGQLRDARGTYVRYGVANPGGSDLIGWTPVVITEAMVGRTLAVFTAIECKTPRGHETLEQAQFISRVRNDGGLAVVARSSADVDIELKRLLAV